MFTAAGELKPWDRRFGLSHALLLNSLITKCPNYQSLDGVRLLLRQITDDRKLEFLPLVRLQQQHNPQHQGTQVDED